MIYPITERQARFIALAQKLAASCSRRAAEHDRAGTFPFENFEEIRASGLPRLVVPEALGGWGANLLETVRTVETLAVGDGSTALGITMHFQTLGSAAESRHWPEPVFHHVCEAAVRGGALINAIASEPELGSPSRGGKPKTTARPVPASGDRPAGWLINGRKNFASLSPTLDFMVILAAREDGSDANGNFVVEVGDGVEIVETWDAMGMRSTGSHDVLLHDVFVPAEHLIPSGAGHAPRTNPWFPLTLSAVYVGVAEAALQTAARYAQERVPTALGKPIAELESIQRRLGQAELLLHQARGLIYQTAALWDERPDCRDELAQSILVAKYTATNNAVAAVDHCMRVAGGAGMSRTLPLERYYRDVRGGLNHPMNDDQLYVHLGRQRIAHQ